MSHPSAASDEPSAPVSTSSLALRTLGGAALVAGPGEQTLLGPGKPLALLIFLALSPARRTSREALLDLLWSDVDPDRARNALRQTLFQLRRLLGDDAIVGAEELTLARTIGIDREELLAALGADDLDRAVALYRGDFLPAFGVPGGAAFEQWADLERHRLRAGFQRGAEMLVRRHLNQARFTEARSLARRIRDAAPHDEAAARLVLEASIASRDFVTATMDASALEQWAQHEGLTLEPATRAMVARARRTSPAADSERTRDLESGTLVAELTGREQEFFAITSAWDAVRSGPARHLHLSAPAGFGKSRLLRDAIARLEAGGATVVQLRGKPGDRDVPYAFASDMAAAIAELPGAAGVAPAATATLLALNPALSARMPGTPDTASGEEALRRRMLALSDLIHSAADEQRFVLAIDDVHWIDTPSYRVLEGVWSRLNRAHLLCLTASRPERTPMDESCVLLPLAALTGAQIGALVSALGAIPPGAPWSDELIAGLLDATLGSPLLVLETLHHALDQQILALHRGEWQCLDTTRLASLLRAGEALRERMRTLPESHLELLALLATAGTPLERTTLMTIASISRDELASRIEPLERQGFVVRSNAGLVPAHDEIAAASLAALPPLQRAALDRRIGTWLADAFTTGGGETSSPARAAEGSASVLRAVRHFEAAGEHSAVHALFRRYAMLLRRRGDRRRYDEIAAELLGASASVQRTRTLVAELPLAWRVGLWSAPRQIAATLLLIGLPIASVLSLRARAATRAAQQHFVMVDSAGRTHTVAVDLDTWENTGSPLAVTAGASDVADIARRSPEVPPAISPDGRAVAWTQDAGDSTTLDVWMRTTRGVRRLTQHVRDDRANEWMPDGSALVGVSDRWWQPGSLGYDIALFDTATGAARQVTRGPAHDGVPTVSLDGTRIAFGRESNELPAQLCVIAIDGVGEPDCRLISGQPLASTLGWTGLDEIAIIGDTPAGRSVILVDWARNTTRVIMGPYVETARLSPDRKWIAATMFTDGVRGAREWIAPITRPARARQVAFDARGALQWWEGRPDGSLLIDHLEFSDTASVLPLGTRTRLRVRPLTAANIEVPLRARLRWRSSDTTIATVDSLGEIRPRTSGTTVIEASLVGWRVVRKSVRIEGEAAAVVLDEQWDATWPSRWLAWGDPEPTVVAGPQGVQGFWNHGDGVYPSMGVLRRSVSARHGLGMDVRLSTPITRTINQRLRIAFTSGIDTAALQRADQHKAPPSLGRADATCIAAFPVEGRWGASRMAMSGVVSNTLDLGKLATSMRSGAWWTLRLQILPDGRCGVAINNRVVWMSTEPLPLDGEFRVRLGDESRDARLLHGPLRLWTGVPTDVDWTLPAPTRSSPSR